MKTVATVRLEASDAGPLWLASGRPDILVAPTRTTAGGNWDRVTVIDVARASSRDVAHSAWSSGLINWVAATNGWIVYVDQSAEQGPTAPAVRWRIRAINVATSESRDLASSGGEASPYVPVVGAQDGYIYWTQAERDRSARELVWNTADPSATPIAVLRHAEMTPGSASILGDTLVYLGPNGKGLAEHTTGGDCWQVPLTGGTSTPLTHTALAMGCAARGTRLAWSQHIDPDTPTPPADGIYDDPYSLWTLDTSAHGTPVRIQEGYSATYDLHLTDEVLVWQEQSGRVVLSALARPGKHLVLPTRVDRIATGPDGLVGYTHSRHGHVVVEVAVVGADG